ncbi:two-component system KDP operon response regulator KdpE [Rhizobium sp. PP-F2F-G38]|uniref:response regulator transcription factor n=1 Tax=Rhizobium sp. PP-CC-3G-465 TaxID=2135648 RepID=UPI000D9BDDC7|nr:two-component system KDP operon response regulator KdpE [Rhizobium sp. PP-WC-1G-195]PYE94835.1 two-component system KDP operon response regulator KdpE [Rhizobium sp. PP-F2F-G38]TCQ25985.1 two-component system KDP operon response regulator KdpE [Rhizobium sp. PP-CC-3G-465]
MTHATVKILVVDDEPPIRKLLDVGLSSQGFAISGAPNARSAIALAQSDVPDLVLLDLGLPDMSGHELLARWRSENVPFPVIILSSRTDETGIVQALELGADDYVTKPFGMNELVARIRVALRHRFQSQGEAPVFEAGDLSVDLVKRIVKVRGSEVKMTPREYDILRLLVQHSGRVLTHRFILEKVWGEMNDVQYLRVYVRQLRQKIEESPDQPRYILTETGVGYRLAEMVSMSETRSTTRPETMP